MLILFIYDLDDMGVFGDSRVKTGINTPILRQYDFMTLSIRQLPPWKRIKTMKQWIDRTDLLAVVSGSNTFMRSWALEAAVYGFTKNKPMMDITQVNIDEGWSKELQDGPSPFSRVKWQVRGDKFLLYSLDTVLETVWLLKTAVPQKNVSYRLRGKSGLLDEIAPIYDWVLDNPNQNFPEWVRKSVFLAGGP